MIYVGCDDSGYQSKLDIFKYLSENNIPYVDCGSGNAPSRYPYFAARVASAVSRGNAVKGILICGSGIGVSIAANKFRGVRAAAVTDTYSAMLTRRHNDSNVLCLGGQMLGRWAVLEIVKVWLCTEYDEGHHQGSLKLLSELEELNMSGECWCPEDIPYAPFDWDPKQSL